ncbi:MAG: hypothetical protein L0Y56_05530, partial [Nitrospira sp.]|nr:hypothetical protein [Nitrospira sp.]
RLHLGRFGEKLRFDLLDLPRGTQTTSPNQDVGSQKPRLHLGRFGEKLRLTLFDTLFTREILRGIFPPLPSPPWNPSPPSQHDPSLGQSIGKPSLFSWKIGEAPDLSFRKPIDFAGGEKPSLGSSLLKALSKTTLSERVISQGREILGKEGKLLWRELKTSPSGWAPTLVVGGTIAGVSIAGVVSNEQLRQFALNYGVELAGGPVLNVLLQGFGKLVQGIPGDRVSLKLPLPPFVASGIQSLIRSAQAGGGFRVSLEVIDQKVNKFNITLNFKF